MLDLVDYDNEAREAIRAFWGNREAATKKQRESGRTDPGGRSGVTAGKNLDGFVALVRKVVEANGLQHATIAVERSAPTLPGYFRPTKTWDVVVVHRDHLVAVVELKSQVGPSFGNNFNNRAEEVLGSASDLWTAFREGAFGDSQRPFVGWLMVFEDCPKSRRPVRVASPHFPAFPEFQAASYADRYEILCRKLVHENLYSAATLLLTRRDAAETGDYTQLSKATDLRSWVAALAGHVAAEAARSRPPTGTTPPRTAGR